MKHVPIIGAPSELRDSPRKHVLMHATIITTNGPRRVHVKDLTASGARITCDHAFREDSDLLFARGELCRAARVAWTKRGEAGLQFYRES